MKWERTWDMAYVTKFRIKRKLYRRLKRIYKESKGYDIVNSKDTLYITVYCNFPFIYWLEVVTGETVARGYRLGFNYCAPYLRLI